jgi:hydrogenase maturation protease
LSHNVPPVLVLGLGNLLREDEGTGLHLVRHLESEGMLGPGAEAMDGGTGGLHLVGELAGRAALLVADAAELGEAPGTVRLLEGEALEGFVNRPSGWNVHDVGLPDLFAAAALLPEGLPPRRAVVAVQPASFGWHERPSPAVAEAIPEAAGVAADWIGAAAGLGSPAESAP